MNTEHSEFAIKHKRKVSTSFMLVEGEKIGEKVAGTDFTVTRKVDGVMQIVFFNDGQIEAYNSGGKATPNLPCLIELAEMLKSAGIKEATLAAELYANIRENDRERVCDVATALADDNLSSKLHLAPFDIISIDGQQQDNTPFKERIKMINRIFGKGEHVRPVESKCISSKYELVDLFNDWVGVRVYEGLVVHSELPFIYKIKPRHSVDAVVIGYTVGEGAENDSVRSLLFAVMCPDGNIQQIGSGSSGLSEKQREDLYDILKELHVYSDYLTTDSRNVAYQMVQPKLVFEISAVDFVTENSAGEPKLNMLLEYTNDKGYKTVGDTPGVAMHGIAIVGQRFDKAFNESDIRVSQITDLCEFSERKQINLSCLPQSTLLSRRVFVKNSSGRTAVHKFLVWKTNKELSGRFPAYVLHHTDYCAGRKDPLQRDLRVSNSRKQIFELAEEMIENTIKKGWKEII